jgi:CheY-like chemotaxis protein
VNQSNETLTSNEERSCTDPLSLSDGPESTVGVLSAVEECALKCEGGIVSEKGQVLLLEDDLEFRDIAKELLTENGYTVVAVANGGEGVREVLARNFTLVLCDFMMPGLPGDIFFRAVQRIRPSLCQRFVFMTGHQTDERTLAFIKSVDGFVLQKPFPLQHLLDSVAFAEARVMFQSVFDGPVTEPIPLPDSQSVSCFQATSMVRVDAEALERIRARGRVNLAPAAPSKASEERKPRLHVGGVSMVVAGLAFAFALLAPRWSRYQDARDSAAAAEAKREAAEAEWTRLSPNFQTAVAAQPRIEAESRKLEQIAGNRAIPPWSPSLRSIVPAWDAPIEILEVQARGQLEDLGAFKANVRVVAGGSQPREAAERFRQAVEASLKRSTDGFHTTARIEQLEDVPGAVPDQDRASFLITATVDLITPPVLPSKGGG